jgi:hypothetical protein
MVLAASAGSLGDSKSCGGLPFCTKKPKNHQHNHSLHPVINWTLTATLFWPPPARSELGIPGPFSPPVGRSELGTPGPFWPPAARSAEGIPSPNPIVAVLSVTFDRTPGSESLRAGTGGYPGKSPELGGLSGLIRLSKPTEPWPEGLKGTLRCGRGLH